MWGVVACRVPSPIRVLTAFLSHLVRTVSGMGYLMRTIRIVVSVVVIGVMAPLTFWFVGSLLALISG